MLVVCSTSLLVYTTYMREQYVTYRESGSSPDISVSTSLDGGHSYLVYVTLTRSAKGSASVHGTVEVIVNGTTVHTMTLSATRSSGKPAKSVTAVASEGYELVLTHTSELVVRGNMTVGDSWEVKVYADIPQWLASLTTQAILFFGATVVLLMGLGLPYVVKYHTRRGGQRTLVSTTTEGQLMGDRPAVDDKGALADSDSSWDEWDTDR